MQTPTSIEFDVVPTAPHKPLSLTVRFDGEVKWQRTAITEICHVVLDFDDAVEANRCVQFEVANKVPEHTKVDSDGNILEDSLLSLRNIMLDGIDITNLVPNISTYTHDFNGTGSQQTDVVYGDLGCNGVATIEFSSPVYLWILANI